ncbi:hypothetical protein GCM10009821_13550 [Aeromicrobium halocynthiae]|uniref:Uncharacterized protein n=1 Tax=Aeromicrobium halocynthiae TaxID=560557 RepID=A0ABN2VYS6_9ACTN
MAALLLGLVVGYDLVWHAVNGIQPPLDRLVVGVAGVLGAVLAVASHRAAGPRWGLRACLGLCLVTLALMAARESLVALDDAVTNAAMDLDRPAGRVPWDVLSLLLLAGTALVAGWPAIDRLGTDDA